MFLKYKIYGIIKVREGCNGNKQWYTINKEGVTSSTMTTYLVIITATIEVYKGCDGSTFNIPGAYFNTDTY